jgi:hypothetical protein
MKKALLLVGLCLTGAVSAESWNQANDPNNFNAIAKIKFTHFLSNLPLEGKLKDDRLGWSESYWPSYLGGISYRWNHPNPQPFTYRLHSQSEIMRMSQEELGRLSPSELYDISQSDYDYSLTSIIIKGKFPRKALYNPNKLWWEGICHGWALAASNYPEPDKTVVVNKEGVRVPFGASDVKGLLAMHDSYNSKGRYVRVGARCGVRGKVEGEASEKDGVVPLPSAADANRPECRDVNAGAFHVVITNMIGINSQGFVADIDRFNDVWNQPIIAYESNIIGDLRITADDRKNGIYRRVQVKTDMIYGDELEFKTPELVAEGEIAFVSKEPVTGTPMQATDVRHYEYVLELDARGRITGGEWITETRPDMLWMKSKDTAFLNGRLPLAGLNSIYKPVKR